MNHLMIEEALRAPRLIQEYLREEAPEWAACIRDIQERKPTQVVTIARGSSDHAAQFLSYVLARTIGFFPTSLSPSLVTLHEAPLRWEGTLAIAISQSGASPDLCACMEAAREGGALTLALLNKGDSPLARIVSHALPMHAGEEKSVAATKTFLFSLVHALKLIAHWSGRDSMLQAIQRLPAIMEKALQATEGCFLPMQKATSLLVLGRGQGLPIAQEIALKFNEVCRLPALAYSSAEFRHGPMALIREGDPVLVIGLRGPELEGVIGTVQFLKDMGAAVTFVAPVGTEHADIAYPVDEDPLGDPIIAVQVLYPLIAMLAVARGYDPDRPAHLRKVTMTM